ncbi:cytochrome c [Vibrio sp. SS-MA-C1-2]|uniref:c-type cytochrome n=1 Tax=Vibrio sp. SS-MA-C1-2 TaxID=2908646 RepID=UPI001F256910|nr:cytochrome c [Vibrio sp. SS-MA-C1-2]UJF17593.1 cytochrome c [Vibrio sp. SS-MA-C1-2]
MKLKTTLISLSFLFAGTAVANTFNEPDKAIEYRQATFTMIAGNLGQMADMVKGKQEWNSELFAKRAEQLSQLSLMPQDAFAVKGSDKGDTKAKPEIWSDWDGFTTKLNKFQADTANLAKVAAGGDQKAIKQAFGQAAKNCKACHSDYKYK